MKTENTTIAPPAAFLDAYIAAALWSSTATISTEDITLPAFAGKDLEIGDDYSLDRYFSDTDLAPETRAAMEADCADFLAYCEVIGIGPFPDYCNPQFSDMELSGHDFWLTRNRHGAGYWDRGLRTGDSLTAAAKTFGGVDLYVGDDGLIYQS